MEHYKNIKECRVCGNKDLKEVLKIKPQYIATTFVETNENNPLAKIKIPMTLLLCSDCGLCQLRETVNPELLYRNYFYRTSVNQTMQYDLRGLVEASQERTNLSRGDYVLDIGANDMTMVQMFPSFANRVGVEPAKNIDWSNVDKSIRIINDYFSEKAVREKLGDVKFKIITSTACFYDFPNPNVSTIEIKNLLHKDGVCLIQVSYLLDTIKGINYQDLVHEHLLYYSLETIEYLMEKNGLSIFDCETNFVNGGSIRLYITHKENKREKSENYYKILEEEKKYKLKDFNSYSVLENRIGRDSILVNNIVREEIDKGGKVIALAASTKGNVLLQMFGLDNKMIPFISDRNKEKVGLRALGTDILLISEEEARKMNPSLIIVLTHHFKKEIVEREREYLENGGRFLFLMPELHILDKEGEFKL